MCTKLKLFHVTDEYIEYLRENIDNKVLSNKEEDRKKGRKYLGVTLDIDGFKYFLPLSSPKDSDYITDKHTRKFILDENGRKQIRRSIVPIMRIVVKDKDGFDELKGTLKFSSMIPVPECALIDYDVDKEEDEDYKILVTKELSFILPKTKEILKNANLIYTQKTNALRETDPEKKANTLQKNKYLHSTVNFLTLAKGCKKYESIKLATAVVAEGTTQIAMSTDKTKDGQASD